MLQVVFNRRASYVSFAKRPKIWVDQNVNVTETKNDSKEVIEADESDEEKEIAGHKKRESLDHGGRNNRFLVGSIPGHSLILFSLLGNSILRKYDKWTRSEW